MLDGSEQLHQFIASSRTSLPISLPFPLHVSNPSFDHHHPYAPPPHSNSKAAWSNDELLALLKLRSTMDLWFPDFTWEHISRKLGELGFKRSGDECKEKLEEEESRHFNSSKNYRILSEEELDQFYHGGADHEQPLPETQTSPTQEIQNAEAEAAAAQEQMNSRNPSQEEDNKKRKKRRRNRDEKMEMVKGFCEAVVNKMMAKQEELHNKLIQEMVKRDEEKMARDEAWKDQEMDRIRTQIEIRTKEHKSAADRQATIIDFLKQYTSDHIEPHSLLVNKKTLNNSNNNNSSNSNSNSSSSFHQTPAIGAALLPSSPSSIGDVGKRWPRDEVVALINLRCRMSGGGEEGGNSRGPLWERISQGMMEMGYKRSGKRCKEKWENINKYFRKTKDSSKKRSPNSRTCPYFHHLTSLYSDGAIPPPTAAPPENFPE